METLLFAAWGKTQNWSFIYTIKTEIWSSRHGAVVNESDQEP